MREERKEYMQDIKDRLIIAFGLLAVVGLGFGAYESYLRKELEKKNAEMEQELFDIRWQLEQVDWICGVANQ